MILTEIQCEVKINKPKVFGHFRSLLISLKVFTVTWVCCCGQRQCLTLLMS